MTARIIDIRAEPGDATEPYRLTARGLGFRFEVIGAGIRLDLDRLRESRGELSGELTVSAPPGSATDGHLFAGRFNLSSHTTRTSVAKHLSMRVSADWHEILERFCLAVNAEHRRGEPLEWIRTVERRPASKQLIRRFLEEGKPTVLAAPGGTGKTTLAALISYALVTGLDVVPGLPCLARTNVLVLDYEGCLEDWTELVMAAARGMNGPAPEGLAYRRMSAPLSDDVEAVAALVAEHEIGVVVVDSTEAACGSSEGEGVNDRVNRLHNALRSLKVASLLIDHVAAVDLGKDDALHKPIGGVMKVNRARAVFELKREREPQPDRAELLLLNPKVNRGPKLPPLPLALVYETDPAGNLISLRAESAVITADELARNLTASDRIHRALAAGPMAVKALAEALEKPDNYVRAVLSKDAGQRFVRLNDGSIARAYRD